MQRSRNQSPANAAERPPASREEVAARIRQGLKEGLSEFHLQLKLRRELGLSEAEAEEAVREPWRVHAAGAAARADLTDGARLLWRAALLLGAAVVLVVFGVRGVLVMVLGFAGVSSAGLGVSRILRRGVGRPTDRKGERMERLRSGL